MSQYFTLTYEANWSVEKIAQVNKNIREFLVKEGGSDLQLTYSGDPKDPEEEEQVARRR